MTTTHTVHLQTPACMIANDPDRTDEQKIHDLHELAVDKMFRVIRLEMALGEVRRTLDEHEDWDWDTTIDTVRTLIRTALRETAEETP